MQSGKVRRESLAADVSNLSLLIQLKEFIDKGDKHAQEWFDFNKKLFYSKEAKSLVKEIKKTDMQEWWTGLKEKIKKTGV